MNFKARTLKKNSFFLGFGRGPQVGKASFLKWIYGASIDVGRIVFIWYASNPGIPPTLGFWKKTEGEKMIHLEQNFYAHPQKKNFMAKLSGQILEIIGSDTQINKWLFDLWPSSEIVVFLSVFFLKKSHLLLITWCLYCDSFYMSFWNFWYLAFQKKVCVDEVLWFWYKFILKT